MARDPGWRLLPSRMAWRELAVLVLGLQWSALPSAQQTDQEPQRPPFGNAVPAPPSPSKPAGTSRTLEDGDTVEGIFDVAAEIVSDRPASGKAIRNAFRPSPGDAAAHRPAAGPPAAEVAEDVGGPVQCPGSVPISGQPSQRAALVNAKWNLPGERAGKVESGPNSSIIAYLKGRTYFADTCQPGAYSNEEYVAWKLLGKTLSYTTDVSSAGCGCNAALYMTNLAQNSKPSGCKDHYCDANSVCGEACAEIDIQEANAFAWHSTLHVSIDGGGKGGGYGGGDNGWAAARDWTREDYGPGSGCIDTSLPFQVAASFPVGPDGVLEAMSVVLSQEGRQCTVSTCLDSYYFGGRDRMAELTWALADGMTPIISYWASDILVGMDGLGPDKKGPCPEDHPETCGESVRFWGFKITDIPPGSPTCPRKCSSYTENCRDTACCNDARRQCYEKDSTWASCRESCTSGVSDPDDPSGLRSSWTCRAIGEAPPREGGEVATSRSMGSSGASMCSKIGDNCAETRCCEDVDRECYQKDETFASCLLTCNPGIDESEPETFQKPWSCNKLSSGRPYSFQVQKSLSSSGERVEVLKRFSKPPAGEIGTRRVEWGMYGLGVAIAGMASAMAFGRLAYVYVAGRLAYTPARRLGVSPDSPLEYSSVLTAERVL